MGSLATSRGCMKGFLSDLGWSDGMFKSYLETMINWPTGDQHWHPPCSWKARVHLGVGPRIGIIPRIQIPSLCHSRLRLRLREGLQIYPTYIVSWFMGEPTHRRPHDHQGHSYQSMIFSINQSSWLSNSIKHHYSSKILNKIISSP